MATYITAQLIGGPQDGAHIALPHLLDVIRIPIPGDISRIWDADTLPTAIETKEMQYRIALDPAMGRPSIDDQGLHRYIYIGVR